MSTNTFASLGVSPHAVYHPQSGPNAQFYQVTGAQSSVPTLNHVGGQVYPFGPVFPNPQIYQLGVYPPGLSNSVYNYRPFH